MKRIKIGCVLVGMLILAGCSQQVSLQVGDKEVVSIKLIAEELTEREQRLIQLADGEIFLYKLDQLPTDVPHEIMINYEVYEDGEKVEDKIVMKTIYDGQQMEEESRAETRTLEFGLNIKEDGIKCIIYHDGVNSTMGKEVEEIESFELMSKASRQSETTFNMNERIYLYYAASDLDAMPLNILGKDMTDEVFDELIAQSKTNVFIGIEVKPYVE